MPFLSFVFRPSFSFIYFTYSSFNLSLFPSPPFLSFPFFFLPFFPSSFLSLPSVIFSSFLLILLFSFFYPFLLPFHLFLLLSPFHPSPIPFLLPFLRFLILSSHSGQNTTPTSNHIWHLLQLPGCRDGVLRPLTQRGVP